MIKAIFWIAVFFFFIAVLFYGIRYIFICISKIFQQKSHYTQSNKIKNVVNQHYLTHQLKSHHISFYDPTLNTKVESYADIIKCYREHDKLWVKVQLEENNAVKTIAIEHISMIENLLTKEYKSNPNQILEYFNRFI